MNPMYKEAGRKIAEGKVCWTNLLSSAHYHIYVTDNGFGSPMDKVQVLNLQGITVQLHEVTGNFNPIATNHKAYWAWEKLVAEGNVG